MNALLVDCGNTRLKWARWQSGRLAAHGATVHHADTHRITSVSLPEIAADTPVLVSNVAGPAFESALQSLCQEKGLAAPRFIRTEKAAFGLLNGYADPERLGVDRWLGMIAAYAASQREFFLVDVGSAVTIDHVDQQGHHLGGIIAPGYLAMQSSLGNRTALAVTDSGLPLTLELATSTEAAIATGCAAAVVGLVEHVVPGDTPLIITGGHGDWLAGQLQRECELVPDLVFQGLARYAEVM